MSLKIKGRLGLSTIHQRHHVIPSSRSGPNAGWNLCYFRIDEATLKACRNLPPRTFKKATVAAHHYLLEGKTYIDTTTLYLEGIELDIHRFLHTSCFHSIFANALPSEQIAAIRNKYTNKDGTLNKRFFPARKTEEKIGAWTEKKIRAWIAVFGPESVHNTQIAIDFIEKHFLPIEQRWRANRKSKNRRRK